MYFEEFRKKYNQMAKPDGGEFFFTKFLLIKWKQRKNAIFLFIDI